MIDVSTFHMGDRCPRCTERRVYAVSIPTDEWRCVPNAVPVPWLPSQVREHNAADETQDSR